MSVGRRRAHARASRAHGAATLVGRRRAHARASRAHGAAVLSVRAIRYDDSDVGVSVQLLVLPYSFTPSPKFAVISARIAP